MEGAGVVGDGVGLNEGVGLNDGAVVGGCASSQMNDKIKTRNRIFHIFFFPGLVENGESSRFLVVINASECTRGRSGEKKALDMFKIWLISAPVDVCLAHDSILFLLLLL